MSAGRRTIYIIIWRYVYITYIPCYFPHLQCYKQLDSGRLPPTSRAAASLLASVDVGMEGTHAPGLRQ